MTTPFSFSTTQQYLCKVDTNIVLNLESNSYSTAMLSFTDEDKNMISIPEGIVVYTYEMMPKLLTTKTVLSPIHPNYYALCWTDRYEIMYEDKLILSTETHRSWNITMYPEEIQTLDQNPNCIDLPENKQDEISWEYFTMNPNTNVRPQSKSLK